MEQPLAIVVDEDPQVLALVRAILGEKGIEARPAASAPAALDLLRSHAVSVILADAGAPGADLAELAVQAARLQPAAVVLALEPRSGTQPALDAVQAGAFDVVVKPLEAGRLRVAVERAVAQHRLLDEVSRIRAEAHERAGCGRLVGRSDPTLALRERLERLAAGGAHVLLVGEAGTGKELCARVLHDLSPRRSRPFAPLRCSALSPDAVIRELLGQERGAPPATDHRPTGLLEAAEGGTLFLDDVLELPAHAQGALATALEKRADRRIDEADPSAPGVRIVSATASDPERAVEAGRFREDLRRRLAAAVLRVPPLRERAEDVLLLARHFMVAICRINDLPPLRLSSEAADTLQRYRWPGNVRELRNAIEQAAILCREGAIEPRDLPDRVRAVSAPAADRAPLRTFREAKAEVVRGFERAYLQELMQRHGGSVTEAARHSGMLRSALQRLLRRHGLRSAGFREPGPEPETRP